MVKFYSGKSLSVDSPPLSELTFPFIFPIVGLFESINPNEKESTHLLEKNKLLNEEIRGLKREHEIQSVRLCKLLIKKKAMAEEEKRLMTTRLEERISDV